MNQLPGTSGPIVTIGNAIALSGAIDRQWLAISINRRLVLDGLWFARRVPLFPIERTFDLSEITLLRKSARQRISWAAIFVKAYALAAQQQRALRQAYVRCPWPHLVEETHSTAMVVVNRQYLGEDRICWGALAMPENYSLVRLQHSLNAYQTEPVEHIFRRQVLLSKMPMLLRRFLYWWNMNFGGSKRARRLGTFTMSTLAGQGVLNRMHQTFLSSSLTYGPLDDNGHAVVTLLCDHRVVDGIVASRAMRDLEAALHGPIVDELKTLQSSRAAA
ncbi:MAG TPA: hypothetical protein VFE46_13525 [Pirellulales bacterium]|jgi:hypothetical protein|nr:hypothetical protein [Pirellulales bacterium]